MNVRSRVAAWNWALRTVAGLWQFSRVNPGTSCLIYTVGLRYPRNESSQNILS